MVRVITYNSEKESYTRDCVRVRTPSPHRIQRLDYLMGRGGYRLQLISGLFASGCFDIHFFRWTSVEVGIFVLYPTYIEDSPALCSLLGWLIPANHGARTITRYHSVLRSPSISIKQKHNHSIFITMIYVGRIAINE